MNRRDERETLFILLFEASFSEKPDAAEIMRLTGESMELETDAYIDANYVKMIESLPVIDEIIKEFLIGRTIDRVSRAALTAMRLAIYEIISKNEDIPVSVSINEAVELVKKYDMEDAAQYVNGVLGSYARSL